MNSFCLKCKPYKIAFQGDVNSVLFNRRMLLLSHFGPLKPYYNELFMNCIDCIYVYLYSISKRADLQADHRAMLYSAVLNQRKARQGTDHMSFLSKKITYRATF